MTRLPRLKGKEIIRTLERVGFQVARTRGSHSVLKHPDGRTTVVPLHSSETIGPGLFRAILRDVEIPIEDFLKLR
jgi:predicted RNA binding protein YcfA (HicA-like mRNA interferase family)